MIPPTIFVWSASLDALHHAELDALAASCDEGEWARARRFRFDKDRRAYLVAHGLLRIALSESYPQLKPSEWRFTKTPRGRPRITNLLTDPPSFSLTHCTQRVACLVTELEIECGIDLEPVPNELERRAVLEHCLSEAEYAALLSLPVASRSKYFTKLWTLKEAVSKAAGLGLHLPFEELDFTPGPIPSLKHPHPLAPGPWLLRTRETSDQHIETVALRLDPRTPVELVHRDYALGRTRSEVPPALRG